MSDKKTTVKKARSTSVKPDQATAGQIPKPSNPALTQEKSGRRWNYGATFWGLLLVAFGGLLLLGNLGIIEVNWSELWRLWPLVIIASGFSVLASTHWLWKMALLIFSIAAILAVIWVGTGRYDANTNRLTDQKVSVGVEQGVTQADVTIQAGASKLTMRSDDTPEIVSARLKSEALQLSDESERSGATQKVILSTIARRNMWFGPQENNWDVMLTERMPMKLTLDAGASRIDADISKVQVTDLLVRAGASDSTITLGDKVDNLNVDIDAGASSTTLRVPRDSGVTVQFDGGLSSHEFEDLKEISEGRYRSQNYEVATNRITIDADAGVASFKIERY